MLCGSVAGVIVPGFTLLAPLWPPGQRSGERRRDGGGGPLATWDLVRHPAHSWASPQASDSIRVSSSACCLLLLLPLIHFIFFPFYMSPCARVHLFTGMVNIQNGTAEVQFLGQAKAGHH